MNFSFQEETLDLVMVSDYKREGQKEQCDDTLILTAVRAVSNGLPIRAVARNLWLKTTTVCRYVNGMDGKDLKTLTAADFKSKMNHIQIVTSEDEIWLSKHLLFIYILLKGLTYIQAIVSLHNMAINWSKNFPANWTKYRMGELIVRVCL